MSSKIVPRLRAVTAATKEASTSRSEKGHSWSRVTSPRNSVKDVQNVPSFMRSLVEQTVSLLEVGFNRNAGICFRQLVACPSCLSDADHFQKPCYFPLSTCVDAVIGAGSSLACLRSSSAISVDSLDEDISFRYVPIFRDEDLVLQKKPFASGGFGNIFRAMLKQNQHAVAKELKPEKAKESFGELQKETSVMSRLHHPNIVCLYGIMLQPLRMILEFCPKGDLLHALRKGQVKTDALRFKISLDIARGLSFLHAQSPPLAHRDLRSPNVLLVSLDANSDLCAKVADFGLTMSVTERLRDPLPTWQWMAPEAQLGDNYTETCDLYSLGIVLFEVFEGSGEVPFSEFSSTMRLAEMIPRVRSDGLRPTLPKDTAPWMKELIERLWSTQPSARPSCFDCIATIQGQTAPPPAPPLKVEEKAAMEIRVVLEAVSPVCMCLWGERVAMLLETGEVDLVDPASLQRERLTEGVSVVCSLSTSVLCVGTADGSVGFFSEDGVVWTTEIEGEITLLCPVTHSLALACDGSGSMFLVSSVGAKVLSSARVSKQGLIACCAIRDGLIWVCTASGDILEVHALDDTLQVSKVARVLSASKLVFAGGSDVWCLCEKEIRVMDIHTKKVVVTLPFVLCEAVAVLDFGGIRCVWMGSVIWDAAKRVQVRQVDSSEFACILEVDSSRTWLGLKSGSVVGVSK